MFRMIMLTVAGGALAAYLASSYGILAAVLAYFAGGTVFAGLGLLGFLLFGKDEDPLPPVQEAEEQTSPENAQDDGSSDIRGFSRRADTLSS